MPQSKSRRTKMTAKILMPGTNQSPIPNQSHQASDYVSFDSTILSVLLLVALEGSHLVLCRNGLVHLLIRLF